MVRGSLRGVDFGETPRPVRHDDGADLDDVPAAVVCAHCGRGDCLGDCEGPDAASQVFAIVPWERSGGPWLPRLWGTARLATLSHDAFFGSLPGGDVAPALRFAVIAELTAVTLHALLLAALACLLFPALPGALLSNDTLLRWTLRGVCLGVPLTAAMAIGLHLLHGIGLDLGARMQGARPRHGVRFGCYSCGWDLVTLPLGVLLTGVLVGPGAALGAIRLSVTVPRRAGAAYLRGVHQLGGPAHGRALRTGGLLPAAALLTVVLLTASWTLLGALLP